MRKSRAALRTRKAQGGEAQDAFRTALAKLDPQERSELAKMLADASERPSQDASRGA